MMQAAEQDAGSLARLNGLTPLEPISFWPPAPGWWVLLFVVLAVGTVFELRRRRNDRAQAYRRSAKAALERINAKGGNAERVAKLATLLKSTALAAYPRAEVASLSGEPWLEFLDSKGSGSSFVSGSGRALLAATYDARAAEALSREELDALSQCASDWIEGHRNEEVVT
jgi:Domain of unknown function (DUF4381)